MLSFFRSSFLPGIFAFFMSVLTASSAPPINDKLPGETTPPVAVPAFVDVTTFVVHVDNENHKLVVTTAPSLLRVDDTDAGYSILYNPQTDHYTGLEHRDYTYWEFSWPEVRTAIEASKRYATRLEELNQDGVTGDPTTPAPSTNTNATDTSSSIPDTSGYVWRQTTDKKKVAGFDCVRWTGDTYSGESVDAWCFIGTIPKLQAAMQQLRTINEPVALVPVRTLVPALIFPIYDALVKGGVTPVQINWGSTQDRNHFTFIDAKTRDGDAKLFTVPKLYVKTTLVTMDGMLNQKQ